MQFASAVLLAALPALGAATTVKQLICEDTACSQNCQQLDFNLNECLPIDTGDSQMFLQCDGSGVIHNVYSGPGCTGQGDRQVDAVGSCLQSTSGKSFVESCQSGFSKQANHAKASVVSTAQNDKSLESPAAQWNCDCEGTYDVCSLTTCYHHESCSLSGKNMNNSKPVGVAAGDHQWACDCQGLRGYCSLTTCFSDCSAGVPMKSAAKSETAKAALPAEGGQNDKSLESPAAQWNCNCQGTYDVCSLTTCYHHESCSLSGKNMNNSKPVGVAAGDHQWACDCQGLRGYCSLTTCFSDCSAGVPMESARVEQILV